MELTLIDGSGLSPEEIVFLHQKLWELFVSVATDFTDGKSTSVSEENAQRLLSSVCFILREHLDDIGENEHSLIDCSIDDAFEHGKAVVLKRVDYARELWQKVCLSVPKLQSHSLTDTLKGIKYGFYHYNIDFFAAEVPGNIDYQLMQPISDKLLGIEYTIHYLNRLLLENYILSRFDPKQVHKLLLHLGPFYPELLINLCEYPLQNALGLFILGKEPFSLLITDDDRTALTEFFEPLSADECAVKLAIAAQKICDTLSLSNEHADYVVSVAKALAPRIKASVKKQTSRCFSLIVADFLFSACALRQ